ncbi:MAG: 2Fe-2S iron-sulfur cluster-binding protein [Cyanobacteria bacterium J06642_9]
MVDILSQIKNPLLRSLAGIGMGGSMTTLVAGAVIGLANGTGATIGHEAGVAAAAIGAGVGAVTGLATPGSKDKIAVSHQPDVHAGDGPDIWKDWRNFVVTRKVQESREITSFYLQPQDQGPLPNFQPGQFLTLKLEIPGQPRPVIRTYSLSDYAVNPTYYRLSIKREGSPKGLEVPPGIASTFMHDQIQEGSVIPVKPPNGKFVLNVGDTKPAILISNGVGITPMISMAKAVSAVNPARPVWFLHGARNGEYHALREEMLSVAAQTPNLQLHFCYSRPRPEDADLYHGTGYVDIERIQSLVAPAIAEHINPTAADYFLCGSPSFMDALRAGLAEWGVSETNVFFESFSKGPKAAVATPEPAADAVSTAEVVFAQSGKTATWTAEDGTLLDFAESQGLEPAYSCRAGICLTCICPIQEGEVAYDEPPTGTPDEGSVLICVSKPKTAKVVLDL